MLAATLVAMLCPMSFGADEPVSDAKTGLQWYTSIASGRKAASDGKLKVLLFAYSPESRTVERIERFIGKRLPEQNIEGLAPLSVLRRVSGGNGARRPGSSAGNRFGKPGGKPKSANGQGKSWGSSAKPGAAKPAAARSSRGPVNQPVVEYRSRRNPSNSI